MNYRPIYFSLDELCCEHVYDKYGDTAWDFFDARLLRVLDAIREKLNKAIYINDWQVHGNNTQSGLRCPLCALVKDKTDKGELYMSAHQFGQAADFHVEGMTPEETRQWIINNPMVLPYPVRLELGVPWVHCDVRNYTNKRIVTFNP